MSQPRQDDSAVVEIRRYSNRRFYDTSQSKHVTLEEIRRIVQEGRDVRITDASTGEDITARTLTQIILDYDDQKIAAFPPVMLHRLIRSSEALLLDFIGKSFDNATRIFQDSQRSAEEQWHRMTSMTPAPQDAARWWQGAFEGAVPPWPAPGAEKRQAPGGNSSSDDLQQVVSELRGQLEKVQNELNALQKDAASTKSKESSRKRRPS